MILISNDRVSVSKKINRTALIRTQTVSTIAFERKKEELYGFRQTVLVCVGVMDASFCVHCSITGYIHIYVYNYLCFYF